MDILFYSKNEEQPELWLNGIHKRLPQAKCRLWQEQDQAHADYALVWLPPYQMLANRTDLKGIFSLGAGVDAILQQELKQPGTLPHGVPIMRLEDAGMGEQMADYALARVLHYFRQIDDYQAQQQQGIWKALTPYNKQDFIIGILGAGALGKSVALACQQHGFQTRVWSRSPKSWSGIQSFVGQEQLPTFLHNCQVLINLLPNTPQTIGILNQATLSLLPKGAFLINIARGAHLVDADLISALFSGQIKAATLDVFHQEPLDLEHPFWSHPHITITPHVSAPTIIDAALDSIVANILRIESGDKPTGIVDQYRGY